jgi:hypothetical protein
VELMHVVSCYDNVQQPANQHVCCGLGEDGADKARVRTGAWVRAGATTRIARRAHTRWPLLELSARVGGFEKEIVLRLAGVI